MTAKAETAELEAIPQIQPVAPAPLEGSVRDRILLYLAVLLVLIGFGGPFLPLIDQPLFFLLKNRLHLSPEQVSTFRFFTALPIYFSFLFGFVRDLWSPFGRGDRGFLMFFGLLCAGIYAGFAFLPVTLPILFIGVVLSTMAFLFTQAAQQGLSSVLGQQHVMSGQVSAVWNIFASVPTLLAFWLGGVLSDRLEKLPLPEAFRALFLVGAGVMAFVALYGVLRPASVYKNIRSELNVEERRHPWRDFRRLLRHWPIYPALLVWFLWNFAPGSGTPLNFYLQDTLHASDTQTSLWNSIFAGFFIPTFMLFGVLCRRFPLRPLLFWGTVAAVPQMVPLLFLHSVTDALVAAAFCGLMGGVATAAYIDLLIRSSPRGLQGTVLMMSNGLYWLVSRTGDRLGSYLFHHFGGFSVCVIAITVVYALILPTLLLVPSRLTATADGQAPEQPFSEQ